MDPQRGGRGGGVGASGRFTFANFIQAHADTETGWKIYSAAAAEELHEREIDSTLAHPLARVENGFN